MLDGLPPLGDMQYYIDLVPGASIPNLPHYCITLQEHAILQEQVDELLQKEFIPESMGQYVVLALLMRKNNGSWRMYTDNRQINHINMKY